MSMPIPDPKPPRRPFGIRKRYSLGALLSMGVFLVYWLQGFAVVCPHLPEGSLARDVCEAATGSGPRPAPERQQLDGGSP